MLCRLQTTLLVSLIVYLHRVLSSVDPRTTVRVLVACLTNVAVDGILSALLHRSQDCFVRVGSSKRIAANVLRHTLHAPRGSKGVEETHRQATDELRKQIAETRQRRRQQEQQQQHLGEGPQYDARGSQRDGADEADDGAELAELEAVLREMSAEKGLERKRRLLSKRVVAVTCAASSFDVLTGCEFPLVLLDECSQMIEPASLLPMQRFRCQRLIAVGDPKQLPPTLVDVEAADTGFESAAGYSGDRGGTVTSCLAKPLFERLHNAGLPTILLRLQYRMHPTLAHMPNQLFYDGQLRDGVGEEERPPLLRRSDDASRALGPLTFVNIHRGQEVRARSGFTQRSEWDGGSGGDSSWRNDSEVRVVVLTITALLQRGIPPSSIGVLTLYKPQWARLKAEIGQLMTRREEQSQTQQQAGRTQQRARMAHEAEAAGESDENEAGEWRIRADKAAPSASTPETGIDTAPASAKRSRRVRAEGVQVNTVDSFQGGEKDIVILSTVRTTPSVFLSDARRVNVALTRARHHLILVGHHSTLLQSAVWKPLLTFVSARCPGCFFPTDDAFLRSLSAMQAVPLAVSVSQADGAAQMQPSHASGAASSRKRGRAAGARQARVKRVVARDEEDEGEEEFGQPDTRLSTDSALVEQADSAQAASTPTSLLMGGDSMLDEEDVPLSLLRTPGAAAPAPSHSPLADERSSPRHSGTVQRVHDRGGQQQRSRGQEEADARSVEADSQLSDGDSDERTALNTMSRHGDADSARCQSPPAQQQQQHSCHNAARSSSVVEAEDASAASASTRREHASCCGEAGLDEEAEEEEEEEEEEQEQLVVRRRKRARVLAEDDEATAAEDSEAGRLITPQRPAPAAVERVAVDAFDFDEYAQHHGTAAAEKTQPQQQEEEEPACAVDIDIFALLRCEAEQDRRVLETQQRLARQSVEHELAEALVQAQRRRDEQARQAREAAAQAELGDEDSEQYY